MAISEKDKIRYMGYCDLISMDPGAEYRVCLYPKPCMKHDFSEWLKKKMEEDEVKRRCTINSLYGP